MGPVGSVKGYWKYGWMILFVFWTLHLVLSARDFFPGLQDLCLACAPGALTPIQAATGLTWTQLVSADPKFATFLGSTLIDDGISGVGLAVFGMIVSVTSYRRGEKWAWYLSWSMPIGILAAQLNLYALTGSLMVIYLATIFTILSVLALLLPVRQFFPREQSA
jgi:hypothetical protein